MNRIYRYLICTALAVATQAAPNQFEVTSLPGWEGALPSRMYSGFCDAGTAPDGKGPMHMHYIFIESEGNPKEDPVVVWYNGGPGAASMFGMLVELGPLLLNAASLDEKYRLSGVPSLIRNDFSWTKLANVVIVNNPPPVGFSYCDPAGPSAGGTSCGPWNDSLVAETNHAFLTNLFSTQFPEFAKNELYITGESYAGIYVPTIVREILKAPGPLNLKGFAVGDGCIGNEVLCGAKAGPWYEIQFMHGHGQVSNKQYNTIRKVCTDSELQKGDLSQLCQVEVDRMHQALGGMYDYNLYDDCIYEEPFATSRSYWSSAPSLGGALNDYPCPGPAMNIWLNLTATREALHVAPDSNFFSGDNGVGFNYTLTEPNLLPFYAEVAQKTDLRVLVYNGDTDPGINSFVTQDKYINYFDSIGMKEKTAWRPWTLDGRERMGGYVVDYEGDWSYLTIRGSGHMVPEFKPQAAFAFLKAFLHNEPYLPYIKSGL